MGVRRSSRLAVLGALGVLVSGCSLLPGDGEGDGNGSASGDDRVVVEAGAGGFAMAPPRRGGPWWATFSFSFCATTDDPVTLTGAEVTSEVPPRELRLRVLTYEPDTTGSGERAAGSSGGFLKGRPTQVEDDGRTFISWAGLRDRGTVTELGGVEVTGDCDDRPEQAGQWVAVSLRVDEAGADATDLRLTFTDGSDEAVSAPAPWQMIACGDVVAGVEEYAGLC
jgi:hypothetical protein